MVSGAANVISLENSDIAIISKTGNVKLFSDTPNVEFIYGTPFGAFVKE